MGARWDNASTHAGYTNVHVFEQGPVIPSVARTTLQGRPTPHTSNTRKHNRNTATRDTLSPATALGEAGLLS